MTPLALQIQQNSCTCGARWTNSYVRHLNGGTPAPPEIHPAALAQIDVGPERQHKICYACAPTNVKVEIWRPPPPPSAVKGSTALKVKAVVSAADLLK